MTAMAAASSHTRKRPVNLTLSQTLVEDAKRYSANLSATVEELLTEYVATQQHARAARQRQADAMVAEWNAVHDRIGSVADEYSPI